MPYAPTTSTSTGIAGVLLAAGLGTRMGGPWPKLLTPLHQRPLVQHAASVLAGAGYAQRLVVVPPDKTGETIAAALAGLGFEVVINPMPERGLLSSFQSAARQVQQDGAVFALADMPLVSAATHAALRQTAEAGASAAQCLYGQVKAPPIFLHAQLFGPLLSLPPTDSGPRELLRDAVLLPRDPQELLDTDTPQALATAHELLKTGAITTGIVTS